jgi:DNA-binding beta-propeller fold protein YncE
VTSKLSLLTSFALALALVTPAYAPAAEISTPPLPAVSPVWPPPPAQPAIRFVRAITGPADWGITFGFFGRISDAVSGRQEERFVRPTGVAERDGVLYVADPGAPALWIVDRPQNRVMRVDRVGNTPLASPVAVALGPDASVFVADTVLKKVFQLDREGNPLGPAAAESVRPAGLAFDSKNRALYVADSSAHHVAVFGPGGTPIRTFGDGGSANGEFNGPTFLAWGPDGVLLVTDALNYRIQAFDRDGRFLWKLGRQGDGSGDFAAPKGVATDSAGHLYVVDALFDTVQVFESGGSLLLAFGERGTGDGQFWLPAGIFINAKDEIYVADAYNHRIQEFRSVANPGGEVAK